MILSQCLTAPLPSVGGQKSICKSGRFAGTTIFCYFQFYFALAVAIIKLCLAVRKKDNSNGDLEYIRFISSKFENDKWIFALKEGHVYSFSYINDTLPRVANNKLAEYTIRNLMLKGYFRKNYNDKTIFRSSWHVF